MKALIYLSSLTARHAGRTVVALLASYALAASGAPQGYYRYPAIHGDQIVFTAEGDLWRVASSGGVAQRLTSHPGHEGYATFSHDGKTLAFCGEYEGPTEVYTMPADGGLPTRRTFEGGVGKTVGWSAAGEIVYSTRRYSRLPNEQLVKLDLSTATAALVPLSQASDCAFDSSGEAMFFTRLPFHSSSVKRYKGGLAENIWKFTPGEREATPLTADYPGTNRAPRWWQGRIYFVSDRDGTMNLWSMTADGGDLRQHTHHQGWDVKWPALSQGRIVYQLGADLRVYDIAVDKDLSLTIHLTSDFDHQREKWIKKPLDYVTSARISPSGDRVVLTARGQIFVAPVGPGRFVEATRQPSVRYRHACFLPDGKSVISLSDESGEVEFVKVPANGVGKPEPLTTDGTVLRYEGVPAPDGKKIAYTDKNLKLWIFDVEAKESRLIAESPHADVFDLSWSPDSRWLAYAMAADNQYTQIWLYDVKNDAKKPLTSDRVYSHSPAWSPDGKWIYFLSDRNLDSVVSSPWGPRQPEPFFDKMTKIYSVALKKGLRSPFAPPNELNPAKKDKEKKESDDAKKSSESNDEKGKEKDEETDSASASDKSTNASVDVSIEFEGIAARVWEIPVPAGNYSRLTVNDKRLFWLSRESDGERERKRHLQVLDITNDEPKSKAFAEDVRSYELSLDGKKLLVRKAENFHVESASASAPAKLEKKLDLKDWTFPLNPRDEWRQMFVEAWRLERDYFYDRKMHGVDWPGVLKKYLPLVDRVTDRAELSDLIGDMVSELAALHIRVVGGDHREAPDQISPARLGALLARDEAARGWRVDHIFQSDPDYPARLSPLAHPDVDIRKSDVIELINGVATLSVPHPDMLLRNQAGKQVLLRVKAADGDETREVVVTPISRSQENDLRYSEWEYTRRQRVEELGKGDIGYVHLRAMGRDDIAQWARDYYPVYNRKGLIIDVRHNGGGNIDSWILEKLLRKAWFYWQPRAGQPIWNMQYAFRGHMVVLCDEATASDGEAFTEGFKRLGLGKVIGTRTWGGEIWLSAQNFLVDRGIATAAEMGVYGPEGEWLIEGHGVEPDIVVDNLPHATFKGEDAQLARAINYLQEQIREHPVDVPPPPPHPDKSFKAVDTRKRGSERPANASGSDPAGQAGPP